MEWHTPVILVLGRPRQKDQEFKVSPGFILRVFLKKQAKD